jgi:excisionase family DNA binding protein
MGLERFIRVKEAAQVLGVSVWTLRQHLKAGEVPHTRFGRAVLIHESFIEQKRQETNFVRPTKSAA